VRAENLKESKQNNNNFIMKIIKRQCFFYPINFKNFPYGLPQTTQHLTCTYQQPSKTNPKKATVLEAKTTR
jgi:hypothetical protein